MFKGMFLVGRHSRHKQQKGSLLYRMGPGWERVSDVQAFDKKLKKMVSLASIKTSMADQI